MLRGPNKTGGSANTPDGVVADEAVLLGSLSHPDQVFAGVRRGTGRSAVRSVGGRRSRAADGRLAVLPVDPPPRVPG
jgi:hypothetical protein